MKKEEADEKLMQEILDEDVTFYSDMDNPSSIYVEYPLYNGAYAFEPIGSNMFQAFLGVQYRALSGDNLLPDYSKLLEIESQNLLFRQDSGVKINRRVAGSITKGKIAYFLADSEWSLILINADGWKKAKSRKLKFVKSRFDEAQVTAASGGDLMMLLRRYVNMDDDTVQHKGLHRMADANVEMIAIAMALGYTQMEFQKILDANKKKLQEAYNQMNPFVDFVVNYMWGKSDVNMAADALYRDMQSKIVGSAKFFPESPSALSRKLNQEKEALLSVGYEFSKGEKKRNNNYLVIRRIPDSRLSQKQREQMARRAELMENASAEE